MNSNHIYYRYLTRYEDAVALFAYSFQEHKVGHLAVLCDRQTADWDTAISYKTCLLGA